MQGHVSGGKEACQSLGFSAGLGCASCDTLPQFGLSALEDECKQCCVAVQEVVVEKLRFASAILEICS